MAAFTFAIGLRYGRPTPNNARQFLEMVLNITLFFVVVNAARTRERVLWLARALMIGGSIAAGLGVLFYVIPQPWTVWVLDRLGRRGYPAALGRCASSMMIPQASCGPSVPALIRTSWGDR